MNIDVETLIAAVLANGVLLAGSSWLLQQVIRHQFDKRLATFSATLTRRYSDQCDSARELWQRIVRAHKAVGDYIQSGGVRGGEDHARAWESLRSAQEGYQYARIIIDDDTKHAVEAELSVLMEVLFAQQHRAGMRSTSPVFDRVEERWRNACDDEVKCYKAVEAALKGIIRPE